MRSFIPILRPLALLLALAPACSRSSAVPQGAPGSANAQAPGAPPPRAAVRGFSSAAPETISPSPSLATERESQRPTVDYPSLVIARDSVGAIVRRAVKPSVRLNGAPARFAYWYAADSVDGWAFHFAVTDSECPDGRVEEALQAAGWVPAQGYAADGDDGTAMGFVTKRFLCVVEGRWDGGDPSDSTYVPRPGCELTVTCVPRLESEVPKW